MAMAGVQQSVVIRGTLAADYAKPLRFINLELCCWGSRIAGMGTGHCPPGSSSTLRAA
jgi:hypothetical protein